MDINTLGQLTLLEPCIRWAAAPVEKDQFKNIPYVLCVKMSSKWPCLLIVIVVVFVIVIVF